MRNMGVRIGFLGGGNMATAMISGLLAQGWRTSDLRVADVDPVARARLRETLGVVATDQPSEVVSSSDWVVLAVKPQQLRPLCQEIARSAREHLVVSIAAGIRTAELTRWLDGNERIVRVMPNTPALLRAGMTGAFALPSVSPTERRQVDELLGAVGKVLWVEQESRLDGVTALSGSGPAYAFYLIEAMQEAAGRLGFNPDEGRRLSVETLLGAARLAAASEEPAATLRARVTSKGGTTERAISVMDAHSVKSHLVEAILAAAERSRELGDLLGSDEP
jgi:pyrroline-5-carboxylate reductase